MQNKIMVSKVEVSPGKHVYIREPKISDTEVVAQIIGKQAADNPTLSGLLFKKELAKQLIVQINEKRVDGATLNLDEEFSFREYAILGQVLEQIAGTENMGKPKIEIVSFTVT
jgi:hypothetical protein